MELEGIHSQALEKSGAFLPEECRRQKLVCREYSSYKNGSAFVISWNDLEGGYGCGCV